MQVAVAASATASRINLVVYAASANLRPRRRLAKYNILKYYTVNVHERCIKYAPCYERERACALMEMSNVVSKNVRHQRKATMNYKFTYTFHFITKTVFLLPALFIPFLYGSKDDV